MWIRFWASTATSNPRPDHDSDQYLWVSDRETDESLQDMARELVPQWALYAERHYYGFERCEELSPVVRERLIEHHTIQVEHHKKMLEILEKTPIITS